MSKELERKIKVLQSEIDELNEIKSNRIAIEVALIGVGLVIGFFLGVWASKAI